MANIFEQVQQNISDPQGGGIVSGFTPTASTVDPLATAIQGLSTLAKAGGKLKTQMETEKLQSELQTGVKDFVAAEEAEHVIGLAQQTSMLEEQTEEFMQGEEVVPEQEAALLTDMRSKLRKWDTAFKQKRIGATEFKIKMESTLKKYINMNPTIASELRRAASATLGFDPTGTELNAIFASQKAAQASSDEITKATVGVMKKHGLIDPRLDTATNIALNGRKAMDIERRASESETMYNAAHRMNQLTKPVQIQLANQESGADLSTSRGSINQILDSDLNPQEKQVALKNLSVAVQSKYRQKYSLLGASEIDGTVKPISEIINQAIDVASGKLSKEMYDNMYQANTNAVLAEYSGTPQGARYLATIKMAKNLISIPASVQTQLSIGLKSLAGIEKLQIDSLGTNGKVSPFNLYDDLGGDGNTEMSKWFKKNAETIAKNADPKEPEHATQFQNIIEGVMIPMFSDPDRVQAIEYDTVLKMAGDPNFVEMVKALPDSDRVKSKLARVTSAYTTALIQKFGKEAFDKYDPADVGMKTRFSLKEAVFGTDEERLVEINIDKTTGEFFFSAKPDLGGEKARVAEDVARRFTKYYATRLNDAVKVTAHLKGHTNYKGMLDQYMERTPELLHFMKPAKEVL